jgi:diaminohydroxyphosphoribosylaminopyrimidine deaminase/5-amino-6-(5-phosphoribosylamino)uracil reductase
MIFSAEKNKIIKKTLFLAKKNLGKVYPNPSVACILTDKKDNILSNGITEIGGRPHAEIIAIKKVKNPDHIENIYVTLEPCFHYGITNPCINEILKLKNLKNIFICTKDPYKKVNGKSIELLKKQNINVFLNQYKQEAILVNQGFFSCQLINRPMISVKIATSLDGKIACHNGQSKWITNEKSRQFVQKIRSQYDCILTTNKTILCDNPTFNVRYPKLSKIQPIRIIIDRNLSLIENLEQFNIFKTSHLQRTIILTHQNIKNVKRENIEFIQLKQNNLNEIFTILKDLGITRVLIESGGQFITSLFETNFIDKIYWFQSNKIIGNDGIPSINNLKIHHIDDAQSFRLLELKRLDNDILKTLINEENFSKIFCHF